MLYCVGDDFPSDAKLPSENFRWQFFPCQGMFDLMRSADS